MPRSAKFYVLEALSTGQFCSGQHLASTLGVSRTSIASYITQLQALGLDIFKVKGKGYQLARPLSLLNIAQLQQNFPHLSIQGLDEVDSTNAWIQRNLTRCEHGQVVLAEYQSAGRGRRGRQWLSPLAGQLAMSLLWRWEQGVEATMGLSLAVGLAVVEALQSAGFDDLGLKWPNDIYHQGRKLGGVLIEIQGQSDGMLNLIVGLGLNVQLGNEGERINQAVSQLEQNCLIDRTVLASHVLKALNTVYQEFAQNGFAALAVRWRKYDIYADEMVYLNFANAQQTEGLCRGIDDHGNLLLEIGQELKTFMSGEVSLRARN